ncbi:DUF1697 domain-containing protein [Streptococcus macacae]|uniref:PF08002 family protein n=1 Tax=Streptococcus macacae NCTC 11558 TaxID=764298 RepID=G5JUK0_9STRE|nr:DUF1697 domain-containing protein [Streptococcus macacae]EHJ53274.1 hypothetical protein STRMA_0828 [Streptococcus macacae NCTC 11558]SUN78641.1 phosphopentomutase [Streptococcus macacae NCTC 11558]
MKKLEEISSLSYVLLLRGINVGGKNKVVMSELRQLVTDMGFANVKTYINSGNLFFQSEKPRADILAQFEQLFAENYPFIQYFSLFSQEDYEKDYRALPDWWHRDLARKDVLFFTEKMDKERAVERVRSFSLRDEVVHFGVLGIYWGKYTESEYLKTSYHKQLMKEDFYRQVTIRNSKTAEKILKFLQH